MLLRHSVIYLLARGLPGVINFLAIAIYTRLLSPEDYGRYALVIAGVGFFDVVFFQWLRLALLRFLPAHLEDPKPLLSTVLAGFTLLALLTGGLGVLLAFLWPDITWRGLILLAVPLLWAQAWFELNLELARSKLQPWRYGLMSGLKAVSALGFGMVLVLWGVGAYGPLLGLLLGMLLVGLLGARRDWGGISLREGFSWVKVRPLVIYGLPFVASFALGFVVFSSDRFMLAWFLGEAAAGVYSAGYDLTWQTLGLLAAVINLAAYPLAVRAFESGGWDKARKQLEKNVSILLSVILPATAGFAVLSWPIANLVLGESFREVALLLPWIALANLIFSLKVYHADLAYQLSKRTQYQAGIAGLAAVVNLGLNLWWIPLFGMTGAAYATLVAYAVAMLASFVVGRALLPVPLPLLDLGKVAAATMVMTLVLLLLQGFGVEVRSPFWLFLSVAVGGLVYLAAVTFMNVAGVRTKLGRRFFAVGMGGTRE